MNQESPHREGGIAIVGMAVRVPGAATVERFWSNLIQGVESIRDLTDAELTAAGVDAARRSQSNFVPRAAIAEGLDTFDATFFGIGRREAELMDPQHRVMLETAHEALEHAGCDPDRFPGAIGVFGGVAPNTYRHTVLATRPELLEQVGEYLALLCSEREYAMTRIAFKLNLRGSCISVNTACSSSAVALHLAVQSLLTGENDLCLVGGARVRAPLTAGYLYQEDGIPSPDGHCRAFDADARGTVIGSGAAMIAIKRLEDAEADADTIYAVLRSTAINNDGNAKVGFTAPSVQGQSAVIAEALALAGVTADQIEYLEAHGTGTAIGDPIEIAAATKAYRQTTDRVGSCAVGSVKTNIGHLDAGAGVTGVIKAALCLQREQIPKSLHYERPNPKIDFARSPFFVADQLRPWPRRSTPRFAAVSSFGLGGTNAHVVLEEPPTPRPTTPAKPHALLLWSTKSAAASEQAALDLAEFLRVERAPLADVAYTQHVGRRQFAHRRALVARDCDQAVQRLQQGAAHVMAAVAPDARPPVSFLFPGGGAQYPAMGRDLYHTEESFRAAVDECLALLDRDLARELMLILLPDPQQPIDQETSERPTRALPLLFTVEYALAQMWRSFGVEPDSLIGHSMGEYTAACLAGVVTLEDALRIVQVRGELFERLPAGSMLSVSLGADDPRVAALPDISVAAINRSGACVLSGTRSAIDAAENALSTQAIDYSRVHIAVAAHSKEVEPILEDFRRALERIRFDRPSLPYVSNVTGTWIRDEQATDPDYWVRHLRHTVRFADGLSTLLGNEPRVLLEVGPGQTLTSFVRQHPARTPAHSAIPSLRHPRESMPDDEFLLTSVAKLWLAGVDIDWQGFHAHETRRKIPIPTYPFERERYWIDRAPTTVPTPSRSPDPALAPPPIFSVLPPTSTPSPTLHPSPNPPTMPSQNDRKSRLLTQIREVVQSLTGLEASPTNDHQTFLELGFDSLLLTQAAGEFRKRFDQPMTLRQLFEQTPTPDALAKSLDQTLPPEAFAEPAPQTAMPPAPQPSSAPSGFAPIELSASPMPGNTAFERIFAEQLQLMREQLALLRGAPAQPLVAAPPAAATSPSMVTAATPAAPPSAANTESRPAAAAAPPASTGHGPWKPVDKNRSGLTDHQQRHLDQLIARFNARTRGSKDRTQQHRARLSDPRTAAGFKLNWKDLVYPIIAERAEGCRLWDVDGNEWIDISMGFGVTLFGHSPPFVVEAVREQLAKNIAIGPQTPLAGEVAERFCALTGMDRVAFCNTGSEAVLAAIRTARTVSGRDRIVVFRNSYHGMFDEVVVKGIEVRGEPKTLPVSPGIPASAVANVLVLEYGDPRALELIRRRAGEIAAVLVEPIQSRQPDVRPMEFVRELRKLTEELDIALVFDEMVTGFRVHLGGGQAYYGVKADIATYGKVVAGGLPIGVIAGRAKYLDALDGGHWQFGDDSVPEAGITWFAGTFVRHPLALAAANAVLQELAKAGPALQEDLARRTAKFIDEANDFFVAEGYPVRLAGFGTLFHIRFEDAGNDQNLAEYSSLYFHYLRDLNIHCHERRPHFLTTAHSEADVARVLAALKQAAVAMREAHFFSPKPKGPGPGRDVPLTDGQREIWLASAVDPDASRAFHLSAALDLKGTLDRAALETAAQWLVDRHEALRAVFDADGECQRVLDRMPVQSRHIDLCDLDPATRNTRIAAFHVEDADQAFDLERGPLVRFAWIQSAPDSHRVVVTAHHLICDGWSLGILVRDLGTLYAAASQRTPKPALPPLPFSKFATEQSMRQRDKSGSEARARWRKHFADSIPVLDLPTDRPRPPVKTFVGGQVGIEFAPDTMRSLRAGPTKGSTFFSTLLTAYAVFLKRLTSSDDVVIGVATAGQPAAGSKDLVGHCVNLYPLRARTDRDQPFSDHGKEIQGLLLDSLDTPDFTFSSLLEDLALPRDPSRPTLLSTIITYETETAGLSFANLEFKVSNNPKRYCMFDLELYLTATAQGLRVEFHYNRDLFDAASVERWLRQYEALVRSILAEPERPVRELSLTCDEERALLDRLNATACPIPVEFLPTLVERQAARTPQATAVIYPSLTGAPDEILTYAELNERADQLAQFLTSRGIGQDDLVAFCLERSPRAMIAILGIWKAGAAYLPLDPRFPAARLDYVLSDSAARMLLCEASTRSAVHAAHLPIFEWERESAAWSKAPARPRNASSHKADRLAYVLYTSGSTGKPKGVELTHRSIVNLQRWMTDQLAFTAADRLLAVTTVSFDISIVELMFPLCSGGTVVLAPSDALVDGAALARLLDDYAVNWLQATPTTWRLLVETGWQGRKELSGITGGEPLPLDLAQFLTARCNALWNLYGPTETTIYSTGGPVLSDTAHITIGRPLANTRVYVADEHGSPVPVGAPGELWIAGAGVGRGYRNRPDLTAERFLPEPGSPANDARLYRTGDLVRLTSNGEIDLLGRIDQQVKVRGVRIELGEIETVLRRQEQVLEAAVAAHQDSFGNTALVAYVVAKQGQTFSSSELREALRRELPDVMVPSAFVPMTALPRTPNRKLDRKALPAPEQAQLEERAAPVAPRTPTEAQMLELWSTLLPSRTLGVKDDFFDRGGHSLLAARLIARVRQEFDVDVPLRALFEKRTVAGLAEVVDALRWQEENRALTAGVSATPTEGQVEIEL